LGSPWREQRVCRGIPRGQRSHCWSRRTVAGHGGPRVRLREQTSGSASVFGWGEGSGVVRSGAGSGFMIGVLPLVVFSLHCTRPAARGPPVWARRPKHPSGRDLRNRGPLRYGAPRDSSAGPRKDSGRSSGCVASSEKKPAAGRFGNIPRGQQDGRVSLMQHPIARFEHRRSITRRLYHALVCRRIMPGLYWVRRVPLPGPSILCFPDV